MLNDLWYWFLQKSFKIRHLKEIFRGRKFIKNLDDSKYYIICPFGIGDLCFAVNAFMSKNLNKDIVFITRSPEKSLCEVFGGVKMIGNTQLCKELLLYIETFSKYYSDKYLYANFSRVKNKWGYLVFEDKTNLWDDLSRYIYKIPIGSLKNCSRRAVGASPIVLTEKDIVLFPDANSTNTIQEDFWVELASILKSKGYNVYTNVVKSNDLVEGTIPLKVTLGELCATVENCAGCISLRSGICDLLAIYSYTKIFVIHSDDLWLKYADTRYFRNFNIENFLFQSKDEMTNILSNYF